MAIPRGLKGEERKEQPWAHRRATTEEITRPVAGTPPFDFDAWMAAARPGDWTPEDEAEMEEWLAELAEPATGLTLSGPENKTGPTPNG